MKIECSHCQQEVAVEEVMTNCIVTSDVNVIEIDEGEVRVGYLPDPTVADGEVTHYQCGECGGTIAHDQEDLYALYKQFILKNKMDFVKLHNDITCVGQFDADELNEIMANGLALDLVKQGRIGLDYVDGFDKGNFYIKKGDALAFQTVGDITG